MHHTVLIADGDEPRLYSCMRFLSHRGYEIQTATGGVECLAKLRGGSPDILILDMEIPWGGGAGVLAALRQDTDVLRPYSIIVSGNVPVEALQNVTLSPLVRRIQSRCRLSAILEETLSDLATFRHDSTEPSSPRSNPLIQRLTPARQSHAVRWPMDRA